MQYSTSDLALLSRTPGLVKLMSNGKVNIQETLQELKYRAKLRKLQVELIHLQNWVVEKDKRVMILFEGGEFAGKGSSIRAFREHLNPRSTRLVALPKPRGEEVGQWYFQRYINQIPKPGEIVFFDRSWYNRAVVEPVNGFCTKEEYKQFVSDVNHLEKMLVSDGIILIKIYLKISKDVQAKRIKMTRDNPLRRWELTKVDLDAQKLWDDYKKYEKKMFELTDTKITPWKIIDADDKFMCQLEAIRHVLKVIDFR